MRTAGSRVATRSAGSCSSPDQTMTTLPAAQWAEFALAAPALATVASEIFTAHPHHVIATTRDDGSPRVGGTNVFISEGVAWIGMMPSATRVRDLRRDPRCAIHTAPLEEDLARGDVRLDLVATEARGEVATRLLASAGQPGSAPAVVFTLGVRGASLVRVEADRLIIESWRPGHPISISSRTSGEG